MRKLFFFIVILIDISAKGQIVWDSSTDVAPASFNNMHPRIVTNADGNPLVIWGRMDDESLFFSQWNGTAFTTPVKLNPSWLNVATASWMGPDIASKGDTVYVVMKQTPEAEINSHIYLVTSFDGGITFSSPIKVDNIADSISRFPTVVVDATGNPVVAFMKFDANFGDSRWVVTRSSDFGNTFSKDVESSGWSGSDALVCDCCPGHMTISGNTIAMLYRDNLNNIRDIWTGISLDGGNIFTDGVNVDQQNWMIMSCPSSGPDAVIIGDTLYASFMNGASGMNLTYQSKTALNSLSDPSVKPLTGLISGLTSQNFPRIASSGNAIAITWNQEVNGSDQLVLRFTNNIFNGFATGYDTVDLNHITNSDVVLSDGNIFVIWEDDNSGTVKYRYGIFDVATFTEESYSQDQINAFPNPFTDVLTLDLSQFHLTSDAVVSVIDLVGKRIISQEVTPLSNIRLNTSRWSPGQYILMLQSNDNFGIRTILKQ